MGHIRPAVKDSSMKKSKVRLEGKQSLKGRYFERILIFRLSHSSHSLVRR